MSHGRIRGYRPPVLPTGPKPGQTPDARGRVGVKPGGAVLGPGQHLTVPGRTGLAHLQDHFDARQRPDYERQLKGESFTPANPQAVPDPATLPSPSGASLDFLARMPLLDDDDEVEERRDDDSPLPGEETTEPFAPRTLELQCGLFTLAEGSLDVHQHPLHTLEAFLDGDVADVSVALNMIAIPYGTRVSIPALDAAFKRAIPFRAVHQTDRTGGAGLTYLEVCVSLADEHHVSTLDRILTVTFG